MACGPNICGKAERVIYVGRFLFAINGTRVLSHTCTTLRTY